MSPSRRELVRGLAAAGALLLAPRAQALGGASKVDVVELVLASGTTSRPEAWLRLLYELQQTTSIETVDRVVQVGPEDVDLFNHPFAVLCGTGALPALSEAAVEQLRRYLSYGGFLYLDDTSGAERSAFDDSVRGLLGRLYPTRTLFPLPSEHPVFRSFFLIQRPVGRVAAHPGLEGIQVGEVTPVIYGRNDLSGALARGADGRPSLPVVPGGENQRREAVKLAVNLVMYALTSNYKQDQAHVAELLREGRL